MHFGNTHRQKRNSRIACGFLAALMILGTLPSPVPAETGAETVETVESVESPESVPSSEAAEDEAYGSPVVLPAPEENLPEEEPSVTEPEETSPEDPGEPAAVIPERENEAGEAVEEFTEAEAFEEETSEEETGEAAEESEVFEEEAEEESEEFTEEAEAFEEETEAFEEESTEEVLEEEELELNAGLAVSYSCSLGTIPGFPQGNSIYLFLPSSASGSVTFQYSGQISSLSGGTISGNTITAPSSAVLTAVMSNGAVYYIRLMKSSVPSMNIQLNGVTLARIHQNKDIKYPGNAVYLNDPANPSYNLAVGDVEMKGRGNSSWNRYDKKGYQIKFSSKTSVLGMPAAKKWILVPSAGDGSLMRNKIAYELAGSAGSLAYTTEGRFVDLWVSGEYRGLYLITEKVEIGSSRLNLKDDKGVLIELDNLMYYTEPVYYQSPVSHNIYVLKEAVNETSNAGFNSFCSAMVSLETNLVNKAPWSTISRQIDPVSFADWYIVNEFLLNKEDLYTSFFLYKDGDGDVIHAGPIWDFDTCEGIYGENSSEYFLTSLVDNRSRYSDIFFQLGRYLEFVDIVYQVYNEKYRTVAPDIISGITTMYNEISASADMNFTKYSGTLGATMWKGNTVLPTFAENVNFLQNWLNNRFGFFNPYNFYTQFTLVSGAPSQRKIVTEDVNNMLSGVRAAVWSTAGGQDDLVWYQAVKSGQTWVSTIDLNRHPGNGEYLMHLYVTYKNGVYRFIAPYTFYLNTPMQTYTQGMMNSTATTAGYISPRFGGAGAYSLVFNADYYAARYPEAVKAAGSGSANLLSYFVNTGMNQRHQGIASFNVEIYRANYPDLDKAFGDNWPAYYAHYINHGHSEGRNAQTRISGNGDSSPSGGSSSGGSSSGGSSSGGSSSGSGTADLDTGFKPVYNGVDYSLVFSAQQYYDNYPDLQKIIGKDAAKLLAHFVRFGMNEGRTGISSFQVVIYRSNYSDLDKAYGNRWPSYYMHYIQSGYREHRNASAFISGNSSDTPSSGNSGSSGSQPAGIELVFNAQYYLNKYPDLRNAYGNDEQKALAHFQTHGMAEGRQATETFNPAAYRARYADLNKAFGDNWPAYYTHYINNGFKEGRKGN